MENENNINQDSNENERGFSLQETQTEVTEGEFLDEAPSQPSSASSLPLPEPVVQDIPGDKPDPEKLIKAILFASPEYVNQNTLKEILGNEWDIAGIRKMVKAINLKLAEDNEPFEIAEANHSFCFRTRPQYHPWIKKLFKETAARKLSQAALEILALVAYKQPITKAEIENIRGVNVDGVLKGLLDKKLITISGRSDKIGNPLHYGTTREFLKFFGINRVPHDLPKLSEFEDLVNSSALLPQISRDGEVQESEQDLSEEDSGHLGGE